MFLAALVAHSILIFLKNDLLIYYIRLILDFFVSVLPLHQIKIYL